MRMLFGHPRPLVLELVLRALRRDHAGAQSVAKIIQSPKLCPSPRSPLSSSASEYSPAAGTFARLYALRHGRSGDRAAAVAGNSSSNNFNVDSNGSNIAVTLAEADAWAGDVLCDLNEDGAGASDASSRSRDGSRLPLLSPIDLFDRAFAAPLVLDPERLTTIGLLEPFGFTAHNKYLSAPHGRAEEARARRVRSSLLDLVLETDSYACSSEGGAEWSSEDLTSLSVLRWELEHTVEGDRRFPTHAFPIDQLSGLQSYIPWFFLDIHPLNTSADAKCYVDRLGEIPRRLDEAIEHIRELQLPELILPPRFVFSKVVSSIERTLSDINSESGGPLLRRLRECSLATTDDIDQAAAALEGPVKVAFENMLDFVRTMMLPAASDVAGVYALPSGDDYYEWQVRGQTTTDFTAEEIHELGLSEVAKIEDAMRKVLVEQLGVPVVDSDPVPYMRRLDTRKDDRALFYPPTEAGKVAVLHEFDELVEEVQQTVAPFFDVRPRSALEVRRMPESMEEGAPGAMYMAPSDDGSRPGIFYVNTGDMSALQRYEMRTLVAHEAIPGHHFQLALQGEMESLPWFRRQSYFYNAFMEGWALYSEKLALEAGFYKTPYDILGHYGDELMRATRLVVDTGLHAKQWQRSEAREFMVAHTTLSEGDCDTELDRYCVLPAQALSYKIGQIRLLSLRENALKQGVSLIDWHRAVLQTAAVPLAVLAADATMHRPAAT